MVRPEDARIASPGLDVGGDELRWSGRIAHTIFRGATRSIVVETDEGRLNVDAPSFGDYSIGDNVTGSATGGMGGGGTDGGGGMKLPRRG